MGFGELIFENDDATSRVERGALVDQLAGTGRDPQLVPGVAAVPAFGPHRGYQLRGIEAAKKSLCDAENLGGAPHAVGGEVLIVEVSSRRGLVCFRCNALIASQVHVRGPRHLCGAGARVDLLA